MPEEPESLPTSGHMESPGFPRNYPNDLHERKTIEVAKGNVINIRFTDFDLESQVDYVEITDGDGTLLGYFGPQPQTRHSLDEGDDGEGSGGDGEGKVGTITSFTETVHVLFHTDGSVTRSGWRLEWSEYRSFLYLRS